MVSLITILGIAALCCFVYQAVRYKDLTATGLALLTVAFLVPHTIGLV